ncbi:hypothetical protein GDO86_019922 [Hymenochirus boettgeri]|uniref:Uncharacterized protein n=1 Tax=Hymenochirus boettgeri TaxID=247094 RepID=A0A8T2IFP7_9PIPI|nr:hypothetical protein GDO86_019922 [Hymenochirus boettgeri]
MSTPQSHHLNTQLVQTELVVWQVQGAHRQCFYRARDPGEILKIWCPTPPVLGALPKAQPIPRVSRNADHPSPGPISSHFGEGGDILHPVPARPTTVGPLQRKVQIFKDKKIHKINQIRPMDPGGWNRQRQNWV